MTNYSGREEDLSTTDSEKSLECVDLVRDRLYDVINKYQIAGFTPAYFVISMGTGMAANLLYTFPYSARWLEVCGIIMWAVSIFAFFFCAFFFVVSIIADRSKFFRYHHDIVYAPYMGCIAMGFLTLVNMLHNVTAGSFAIGVWVFWWIAIFLSIYSFTIVFYFCALAKLRGSKNLTATESLHATFLLPVVTFTVVGATGGLITPSLPTNELKIITLIVTIVLWSNSVIMGLLVISVYLWKLIVHKSPLTNQAFSSFLPIGILGQGSYGILLFGWNCFNLLIENHETVLSSNFLSYVPQGFLSDVNTKTVAFVIGSSILSVATFLSFFLSSFGHYMVFLAVFTVLSKISPFTKNFDRKFTYDTRSGRSLGLLKYQLSFWSMTFPLGTMSLSCRTIYQVYNAVKVYRILGAVYGAATILIVVGCLLGAIYDIGCTSMYIFSGKRIRFREGI